ncbi:unnamed protein product [Cochlearia groenlandica]
MSIVPPYTSNFASMVNAIHNMQDRDNLPLLNPGPNVWCDKTTVTWFRFLHDLSQAIPDILREGWVHAWPTYRFIPDDVKGRWFLKLTRKYRWDPRHNLTVWTQFNLLARTIFRDHMRTLKRIWFHGGEKPEGMTTRVWLALVELFDELGPDNFQYGQCNFR